MLSLIIDTSTERGFAAFFDGKEILFQVRFPFGLNNSKYLLPEIEKGFECLGIKAKDLDYLAVGIGPGSYTGIRVGAMTAKSMAYAIKKPLVTFCSLEAFLPSQKGKFAAILDAKIGGAYLFKEGEVNIYPLDQLGDYLKEVEILVSPCIEQIKRKLEQAYPDRSWTWEEREPDVMHVAHLTKDKWEKNDYTQNIELLYLRKTQAEIERNKRT